LTGCSKTAVVLVVPGEPLRNSVVVVVSAWTVTVTGVAVVEVLKLTSPP
jgi:hypothetical protein